MNEDSTRAAFGSRRLTGPRRAIAEAACQVNGAFTVEELAATVRAGGASTSSVATVYRAVAAMEATGFIERVGTRAGQSLYVRCGADHHHHHIICEGCGKTTAAACTVDSSALAGSGYVMTRHEMTIYGLCPACSIEESGR